MAWRIGLNESSTLVRLAFAGILRDFAQDYGKRAPVPAHPDSARSYHRGVRHASHPKHGQTAGGPLVWAQGDAIIAALPTLLAKQKAREDAAQVAYEAELGASHAVFKNLQQQNPDTMIDIQRAQRFYCLHKMSFASETKNFGYSRKSPTPNLQPLKSL